MLITTCIDFYWYELRLYPIVIHIKTLHTRNGATHKRWSRLAVLAVARVTEFSFLPLSNGYIPSFTGYYVYFYA